MPYGEDTQRYHGAYAGKIIGNHYRLKKLLAWTALAYYYEANDLRLVGTQSHAHKIIMVLANSSLYQLPKFQDCFIMALQEITKARCFSLIPNDYGQDQYKLWYTVHIQHGEQLLSEKLNKTGRQVLVSHYALRLSQAILTAAQEGLNGKAYGYIEPGDILYNEIRNHCRLLNSPLVLGLYLRQRTYKTNPVKPHKLLSQSGFLSPELSLGNAATPQDDTFALAAITYRLLNGHDPFVHHNTLEAAFKQHKPPPVIQLSGQHWKHLSSALALKAEERPADAKQFITDLSSQPSQHFFSLKLATAQWKWGVAAILGCLLIAHYFIM